MRLQKVPLTVAPGRREGFLLGVLSHHVATEMNQPGVTAGVNIYSPESLLAFQTIPVLWER